VVAELELLDQEPEFRLRLSVTSEQQFAPIGGRQTNVDHLSGGELLESTAGETWRQRMQSANLSPHRAKHRDLPRPSPGSSRGCDLCGSACELLSARDLAIGTVMPTRIVLVHDEPEFTETNPDRSQGRRLRLRCDHGLAIRHQSPPPAANRLPGGKSIIITGNRSASCGVVFSSFVDGSQSWSSKVDSISPMDRDKGDRPTPRPHIGFICLPTFIIAQVA
jgi:hypothetical protein